MAKGNENTRPLSPHLQIYRLPLAAILSITHRLTGVGLGFAAVLVVAWFVAAARGADAFAMVDRALTSWLGALVLIVALWGLCYHFCNGIRHLFWDLGAGFDLAVVRWSNWLVLIASVVLTVLALAAVW